MKNKKKTFAEELEEAAKIQGTQSAQRLMQKENLIIEKPVEQSIVEKKPINENSEQVINKPNIVKIEKKLKEVKQKNRNEIKKKHKHVSFDIPLKHASIIESNTLLAPKVRVSTILDNQVERIKSKELIEKNNEQLGKKIFKTIRIFENFYNYFKSRNIVLNNLIFQLIEKSIDKYKFEGTTFQYSIEKKQNMKRAGCGLKRMYHFGCRDKSNLISQELKKYNIHNFSFFVNYLLYKHIKALEEKK